MNQTWQSVPDAPITQSEMDIGYVPHWHTISPDVHARALAKLQHATELAKEWKAIALSMREVNVQLAAANDALIAEAQGLRVAA